MSYSDFKAIAEVQLKHNVTYEEVNWLIPTKIEISDDFITEFNLFIDNIDVLSSEAARCEFLISPLLREVYKRHLQHYSFWIQKALNYDRELCGTPDYMFSRRSPLGKTVLDKPIVILVEAKRNDFEQGWGQCLAELIAAQKLNKNTDLSIYGIVTDGNLWQFGRLTEQTLQKNKRSYTIDDLPQLIGSLEFVMTHALTSVNL